MPKVAIVLVNYNGWEDTIECLKSLQALNYTNYEIVLVDNKSTNDSVGQIQTWLTATFSPGYPVNTAKFKTRSRHVAYATSFTGQTTRHSATCISLIVSNVNGGFAAGNNIGIDYLYSDNTFDFVWFLNNDTICEPDSLHHLVNFYQQNPGANIGILGSKVKYYHAPHLIQCIGGASYNKWTGYSRQIGNNEADSGQYDHIGIKPDLIIGACMFFSKVFMQYVNYLDERFFLFFEEQDLAAKAEEGGFSLNCVTDSVIYHKEGSTIGANKIIGKSAFSDFYFTRSKLLFTNKHYSVITEIIVRLFILLTIGNRLRTGQLANAAMLYRMIFVSAKKLSSITYDQFTERKV